LALDENNEPAVAAGMATTRAISVAMWMRVMGPRAARPNRQRVATRLVVPRYWFVKPRLIPNR
jgi:hypothetical protein